MVFVGVGLFLEVYFLFFVEEVDVRYENHVRVFQGRRRVIRDFEIGVFVVVAVDR